MTHTELNQVILEYMRELYEMEFIGNIKIEDLDPIGYKVSFYTTRGSENPLVIISDLEDSKFLPFIKEELRSRKLHKTKYFSTTKIPANGGNIKQMYPAVDNNYKTEVSVSPLFLRFKDKSITIPFHSKGILIPVLSNTYWNVLDTETADYRLEYEGNGSGYIKLLPKVNHAKDKEYKIVIYSKYLNLRTTLKICLKGARETFKSFEGDFILIDSLEFLVLKDGILE